MCLMPCGLAALWARCTALSRVMLMNVQDYPDVSKQAEWNVKVKPEPVDWKATIDEALERGKAVPEVEWCVPGEKAAAKVCLFQTVVTHLICRSP